MRTPTLARDGRASPRTTTRELRRRLLDHYDRHRRRLPWREESDPYRIWVSEVMLQQTRVETVIPYYMRWMDRFPDLETLAGADEDDALELWAGLGYYSRARNLHRAARWVRDHYAGRIPTEPGELERLPGLGSYTAGAVASIAFGARAAAVDGNVRRVLCRLYDLPDPTATALRKRAEELVDPHRPGDFNQALMELGATVCTPRRPRCGCCPVQTLCRAFARGTVDRRPSPKVRRAPTPERAFAVAVLAEPQGRVLLVRRPREGLLGGMWAFPERALAGGRSPAAEAKRVAHALGHAVTAGGEELSPVQHTFTHLRARYLPILLWTAERDGAEHSDRRWVDPSQPDAALPAAQKRIVRDAALEIARHVRPLAGRTITGPPRFPPEVEPMER